MTTPAANDDQLSAAGHANMLEWMRELTRTSGRSGDIVERDGLLLRAGATSSPVHFNGVARLDPEVPGVEVIRRADEWFGSRARGYSVVTSLRDDRDDDLRAAVESAGLVKMGEPPEMALTSSLPQIAPPDGVELAWVEDGAGVERWVTTADLAYQTLGMQPGTFTEAVVDPDRFLDPWVHSVVALVDGVPLATAQVLLSHGIAGIYWVGTVADARGKGLGEAVTRAVTERAFECGAGAVTLQASPQGEPIYRRLGFETICWYQNWARLQPVTAA